MDKKTADENIGQTVYTISSGTVTSLTTNGILGKSYTNENAYVIVGKGKDKREILYNLEDIFLNEIDRCKEELARLSKEIVDLEIRKVYKVAMYDRLEQAYIHLLEGNDEK